MAGLMTVQLASSPMPSLDVSDALPHGSSPYVRRRALRAKVGWACQVTQTAQMMSQMPAGITLAVDEVLHLRVDWKFIVRRFVQQSATADYSWRMPNRRCIAARLYLPDLPSESLSSIVVVMTDARARSDAT